VAERLIGKGYDLRIFDPQVNLSRLIGANKRFIEQSIPHIGSLMVESCAEAVRHAEVVLVGVGGADIEQALRQGLNGRHAVVDLVGLKRHDLGCREYSGICW